MEKYKEKVKKLFDKHEELLTRENRKKKKANGIFQRYKNPVLTADHTPLIWRYDFNPASNPK